MGALLSEHREACRDPHTDYQYMTEHIHGRDGRVLDQVTHATRSSSSVCGVCLLEKESKASTFHLPLRLRMYTVHMQVHLRGVVLVTPLRVYPAGRATSLPLHLLVKTPYLLQ